MIPGASMDPSLNGTKEGLAAAKESPRFLEGRNGIGEAPKMKAHGAAKAQGCGGVGFAMAGRLRNLG